MKYDVFGKIKDILNKTKFMESSEIEAFRNSLIEAQSPEEKALLTTFFMEFVTYVYKHKRLKYIWMSLTSLLTFIYMLVQVW